MTIIPPMANKIIPPSISMCFPVLWLAFFLISRASEEIDAVTTQIITAGYYISTCNIEKLRPTARASILVAMLKRTRLSPREGSLIATVGDMPLQEHNQPPPPPSSILITITSIAIMIAITIMVAIFITVSIHYTSL
jgi:hypothetical protein